MTTTTTDLHVALRRRAEGALAETAATELLIRSGVIDRDRMLVADSGTATPRVDWSYASSPAGWLSGGQTAMCVIAAALVGY